MMGSLSGNLQRPLVAAAAVAAASFSVELPDKLSPSKSDVRSNLESTKSSISSSAQELYSSWVSQICVSRLAYLSFVTQIRVPVPDVRYPVPNLGRDFVPNFSCSSIISSSALLNLYQSAELAKAAKPNAITKPIHSTSSDVLYRWHLPEPSAIDVMGNSDCSSAKSRTVVVLLGWLGAKQKHLRRYAQWYNSMGYHAITFTFPITEVMSYQFGGKAEEDVELLVNHLIDWLEEEHGKNLVFHTFSNTGWLTYGTILEKFQKNDPSLLRSIKGCIIDSAPVAVPDPQVWASGFSAAFLKKHSVATKGLPTSTGFGVEMTSSHEPLSEPKPELIEAALLLLLEKFFEVILNLPAVSRRLTNVLDVLSTQQPGCPQLYIYSSADRVIPAGSVESFMEQQRKMGHEVRACNFVSTPHVDHFRSDPQLYTSQLNHFLENCVITSCRNAS